MQRERERERERERAETIITNILMTTSGQREHERGTREGDVTHPNTIRVATGEVHTTFCKHPLQPTVSEQEPTQELRAVHLVPG